MVVLWLPFVLLLLEQADNKPAEPSPWEVHRQIAIPINDLAGRIHSQSDARQLIDAMASEFGKDLPSVWLSRSIRDRVAHAEYEAISDPSKLIPEQRVADVWNEYVREIGAPEEALVTVAEIHNLRDADQAGGKVFWRSGNQNIWTIPNIYALGPSGRVAKGCRAVEALRILYELDNLFQNLRGARMRVQQGTVAADLIEEAQRKAQPKPRIRATFRPGSVETNPIRPAEQAYIREHGKKQFYDLLEKGFTELFPPES